MTIYYVILVNGIPEQVTADFSRAKQAERELTSRHREARIVPCRECVPEAPNEFESEEPTWPDKAGEQDILAHGPEV